MSFVYTITGPTAGHTASGCTGPNDTSVYGITGGTVGFFLVPLGTNVYGGGGEGYLVNQVKKQSLLNLVQQ